MAGPCLLDENLAHRAGGDPEEVRAVVRIEGPRPHEPDPRLVGERGRLERLAGPLPPELLTREPAQFRVDDLGERVGRRRVARAGRVEQPGDGVRAGIGHVRVSRSDLPPGDRTPASADYNRRQFIAPAVRRQGALMTIRVVHVGLGPIGAGIVRQVAARKGLTIVGAVDIDPKKAGRDLGEVVNAGRKLRVKVDPDLKRTLKETKPDVVLLCTSSALKGVAPQIETILKRKVPIVSTTEELAYPWFNQKKLASRIDALAKKAKVAVLGTGVNPGFVMDALAITLTGVSDRVDRITINRIQDARIRRLPFQQKIGSGLTVEEFAARVKAGTVRHVGLTESIAMIASAMGWKLDGVTDEIQPKIAETDGLERVPDGGSRQGVRPHPGRHRVRRRRAHHPPPHGGVPRRARVRTTRPRSKASPTSR